MAARHFQGYDGTLSYLRNNLIGEGVKVSDGNEVLRVLTESVAAYELHPPATPSPQQIDQSLWAAYERGRLHYAALGIHEFLDFKCPIMLEDPRHSTFSLNNVFSALRSNLCASLLPLPATGQRATGKRPPAAAAAAAAPTFTVPFTEYIRSEKRYKARKVTVPPTTVLASELLSQKSSTESRLSALLTLFDSNCPSIRSLPPQLISVGCIARYLLLHTTHQQLQLAQPEWHVLVATNLALRLGIARPTLEVEPQPQRRSIHTSNLAQLSNWYMYLANDVCGQPLQLGPAYNAFDGPLWLYCWSKALAPLADLCLGNASLLAAFKQVTAAASADLPPYTWLQLSKRDQAQSGKPAASATPPPAAVKQERVPLPAGGNKFALLNATDE